jgi:hypothetical protein
MWREAETKAGRLLRVLLLRFGAMPADASRKLLHIIAAAHLIVTHPAWS